MGESAPHEVMFRGATKITLDDKGRMVMPTRYREQIAELAQGKLVVTVDRTSASSFIRCPSGSRSNAS